MKHTVGEKKNFYEQHINELSYETTSTGPTYLCVIAVLKGERKRKKNYLKK